MRDNYHWLADCSIKSEKRKTELIGEHCRQKRRKRLESRTVRRLATNNVSENFSVFGVYFWKEKVQAAAKEDQSSEITLGTSKLLTKIQKADMSSKTDILGTAQYYNTVTAQAPLLPCSRKITINIKLLVCQTAKLIMQELERMVSNRPTEYVLVGQLAVQILELDNRELHTATCDCFKEDVAATQLYSQRRKLGLAVLALSTSHTQSEV